MNISYNFVVAEFDDLSQITNSSQISIVAKTNGPYIHCFLDITLAKNGTLLDNFKYIKFLGLASNQHVSLSCCRNFVSLSLTDLLAHANLGTKPTSYIRVSKKNHV